MGRASGTRRSASSGTGSTSTPGLSTLPGSKIALTAANVASASGEYM